MDSYKTITLIQNNNEPIVLEKEEKFIAVSIELMDKEYVVAFDIIDAEGVHSFDLKNNDYETIGIIPCASQDGGFLDFRNSMIKTLDNMTLDSFKDKYF